jgi:hypothetical protein
VLDTLLDGHRTLRSLAGKIEAILDGPAPKDQIKLGQLRWAFTREIMKHLTLEERHVYDLLIANPSPAVRATAASFKDSLGALYADYQKHMQRWQSPTAADWPVYSAATRSLIARLRKRMNDEEQQLYSLIGRSDLPRIPRAAQG